MSQKNPPQKEGQQNEQKKQQQQSMEKPAGWSMDFSSICGDNNGKNAMKVRKWECLAWLLCILMGTTICVMLLFMANPSKGASIGNRMDNGTLLTEIDLLRAKNGQMAEEANVQKALEKVQNEKIAQLRTANEQQAKEIAQIAVEADTQKVGKLQNKTIAELMVMNGQLVKEIGQMLEEKNISSSLLSGLKQLMVVITYQLLLIYGLLSSLLQYKKCNT